MDLHPRPVDAAAPSPIARGVQRDRAVARVLWIVLGLNWGVAVVKLTVGAMIGSIALLADGVHALLDGSSNVVGLVGMGIASRPPDAGHPYGHRRFETLAATTIGLLIAAGVLEIARGTYEGLRGTRPPPDVSLPAIAAVAATILINLFITRYESKHGRLLSSALLEADSSHTRSDTIGAVAVLAGLGLTKLGLAWADLLASAVVCVLITMTAWRILRQNLGVLADHARLDPQKVYAVVMAHPRLRGAHKIRSRGALDHVHLDLHIHLDPGLPLREAHTITHEVAHSLREAFPEIADVIIHTEPADGREHDQSNLAP